jgi:hypothetical protein
MIREPATVPAVAGVYALVNRKRKYAYVAYTSNLQKRSHSLSHMLLESDRKGDKCYWAISDLPRHASGEYVFMVFASAIEEADAKNTIATVRRSLGRKGYRLIDGQRGTAATVTFNGKTMLLTEALVLSKSKVKYPTAWRRIERGWTVEQALGLAEPDPRWDHDKQKARTVRAKGRK